MAPFTHHIFVCCHRRAPGHPRGCCDREETGALRQAFKDAVTRRGLRPLVRANQSGCLDQCELGPTVVIYPQGIWYGGVQLHDVERIIEQTVVQGQIIEDLLIPDDMLNTKGKGSRGSSPAGPVEKSS